MPANPATVRVKLKKEGIECVINESDFDPSVHESIKVTLKRAARTSKTGTVNKEEENK